MEKEFEANLYKVGINACVDVPDVITAELLKEKGFIYVEGTINQAPFKKSLVPVKEGPYRLFVNVAMLKQAKAQVGDRVKIALRQGSKKNVEYEMPALLKKALEENDLLGQFYLLSGARRKSILKYLCAIKTEKTLEKNISKLLLGLKSENKNIRLS